MEPLDGYDINNVRQRVSGELKDEIVRFWKANEAIPSGQNRLSKPLDYKTGKNTT